ncbi:hypothetical protein N9980_00630 [bacterium]|nr:hypothetical protein [bacterium]
MKPQGATHYDKDLKRYVMQLDNGMAMIWRKGKWNKLQAPLFMCELVRLGRAIDLREKKPVKWMVFNAVVASATAVIVYVMLRG